LYVSGALAGFLWMRYGRKNEQITFLQVAFLRWRAVRRGLAAKQLVEAKAQAEAKSYQSAYLLYSSAVRNDPDNIPARLAAGQFFVSVGAINMGIGVLEDGLLRAPGNETLLETTLELLTSRGRDPRALELIRRASAGSPNAPTPLLQGFEV